MKKTFGILFLILGIICLPGCFTGRTEQIIGHLLAATLIGFLPAFLLLRSSRKKKEDVVTDENKQPKWKTFRKVLKITFATLGIIFLSVMIGGQIAKSVMAPKIQMQEEKLKFAQMIERVNNDCPIPLTMGKGQVTAVKLEDNCVTYYTSFAPGYSNALSELKNDEKIKEGILMCILCLDGQGDNRGSMILDLLEKYNYGFRVVITESATGTFDFRATADELATLHERYQLNPHEALYKLLSILIEAERVNYPQKLDDGMIMTDITLEDENIVFTIQVDENLYSISQMEENNDLIRASVIKEGLSQPESHYFLEMCKVSHSGLVYRFTGKQSLKKHDIVISSDEMRKLVDTPESLNIQ